MIVNTVCGLHKANQTLNELFKMIFACFYGYNYIKDNNDDLTMIRSEVVDHYHVY